MDSMESDLVELKGSIDRRPPLDDSIAPRIRRLHRHCPPATRNAPSSILRPSSVRKSQAASRSAKVFLGHFYLLQYIPNHGSGFSTAYTAPPPGGNRGVHPDLPPPRLAVDRP